MRPVSGIRSSSGEMGSGFGPLNFLSALALVLLLGAIVVRLPLAEGRDRKKTRERTVEEIIEG